MENVDFLHPELLPNETLFNILEERKLKLNGLNLMNRDQLLSLYNQYCLPHAQRRRRTEKYKTTNGSSNNNLNSDRVNGSKIIDNGDTPTKKAKINRSASSECKNYIENNNKRQFSTENNEENNCKDSPRKKQKISWP